MRSLSFLALTCSTYLAESASIGPHKAHTLLFQPLIKASDTKAYCVSTQQWPDWDGTIDLPSCLDATKAMIAKVPVTKHPWFFWSGAKKDEPAVPWPWNLPERSDAGESKP